MKGNFERILGSGPDCAIHLKRDGISPRHAALRRAGDRLFVRDLNSTEGVFVNSRRLPPERWIEITRFDRLCLGKLLVDISPKLFLGQDRLAVETAGLRFEAGGRTLCDGVTLRAEAGTLTALMGPSGCGKSVLLSLLTGIYTPTNGNVLLGNGAYDLHRDFEAVREFVGLVPQAEILIPELTVRQSLDYRLRLKFRDMDQRVRQALIRNVAERLGFRGERRDRFLDTRIGAPEEKGRVLSGGERRRANIAHELVTQPLVLLLDEPTSGLSAVDADAITALLKNLAHEDGLTILTTIHQPSREAFAHFDNLILMGLGGKVLYSGPAQTAAAAIQRVTGVPSEAQNPADYLLRVQEEPGASARMASAAVSSGSAPPAAPPPAVATKPRPPAQPVRGVWRWCSQFTVLLARSFRVLLTDRPNLAFAFGQVPILAVLLALALAGGDKAHRGQDIFARTILKTQQRQTPSSEPQQALREDDRLLRESFRSAKDGGPEIGEARARQRATIYFVLCLSALWFGVMGACKEVVTEQAVIRREHMAGIPLSGVLLAKFLVQSSVVGLQVLGLATLTSVLLLGLNVLQLGQLCLVLWLAGVSAVSLGLLLSCVTRSYRAALSLVPLLLIPQVLFAGLLQPLNRESVRPVQWLENATSLRWAFQLALGADPFAREQVMVLEDPQMDADAAPDLRGMVGGLARVGETGLLGLYFKPVPDHLTTGSRVLAGETAVCLALGWVFLRRRMAKP